MANNNRVLGDNHRLQPDRQTNVVPRVRSDRVEPIRLRPRPAREPGLFFKVAAAMALGGCLTQMGLIITLRPLQRAGVPDPVLEAAMKLLFAIFTIGTFALMLEAVRVQYRRQQDPD